MCIFYRHVVLHFLNFCFDKRLAWFGSCCFIRCSARNWSAGRVHVLNSGLKLTTLWRSLKIKARERAWEKDKGTESAWEKDKGREGGSAKEKKMGWTDGWESEGEIEGESERNLGGESEIEGERKREHWIFFYLILALLVSCVKWTAHSSKAFTC